MQARQGTMLVNSLRAHMGEFGIIVPQGIQQVPKLVRGWRTGRPAVRKLPARRSLPSRHGSRLSVRA